MIRRIRERYEKFDFNIQELIRGSFVAFFLKVFSALVVFLFNVIVTRSLSGEDAGFFFLPWR